MADQEVLDPTFTFTPVVPGGDNPQCRIPAVQRNVATFTLIASVLTGALSALVAPKLGSLSDRYGRTSLLTVASCGGVVNEIITIFAAKYPDVVDYHWLLAGAFFDGITGSITAGTVLASSYTSDCSPPSKRGVRIGYMHACFFTGLAFGPLIAGYLVKWTGTLLSIFYVALGCHIFFILFIFFVTPESLSKKRQMLARQKHQKDKEILAESIQARLEGTVVRTLPVWVSRLVSANPLEPLRILVPSGPHRKRLRRNMVLLALMDAIIISVAMGSGAVTILYVEYIFSWDILNTSRFVSFMSFTRVAVLLGLFPLVNYIFRIRPMQRRNRESGRTTVESNAGMDELDVWMLRIALVSDVCGTIGYIFSRSPQLFVFSSVVSSVGGLGGAVIQSAITKHVPAERVGSLLGALGLLHALGRVLAPMLFNGIYAATVDTFPQAFFVMLVSLFGLALIGSLFVRPHRTFAPVPLLKIPESADPLQYSSKRMATCLHRKTKHSVSVLGGTRK